MRRKIRRDDLDQHLTPNSERQANQQRLIITNAVERLRECGEARIGIRRATPGFIQVADLREAANFAKAMIATIAPDLDVVTEVETHASGDLVGTLVIKPNTPKPPHSRADDSPFDDVTPALAS